MSFIFHVWMMDDNFLYLTYIDWNNVKSRLILGINYCSHLTYSFLPIVLVRACCLEPLGIYISYIAMDGELITSGSAFQVMLIRHNTVIDRTLPPSFFPFQFHYDWHLKGS
ncbi:unnamed protein product [Brugia pahangi]|uniref:Neur_chan_LBD domain-containing protein n=1 Tax=Brugia pahangi TaxID=6280 RepID=A0A0N4T5S7_BRUPA|nr:unnamed protein product [Brugia pahangi]